MLGIFVHFRGPLDRKFKEQLGNTGATLEDLGRNSGECWGNLVMGDVSNI